MDFDCPEDALAFYEPAPQASILEQLATEVMDRSYAPSDGIERFPDGSGAFVVEVETAPCAEDHTEQFVPCCRICGAGVGECACYTLVFQGMTICIDRPEGFVQTGIGADGEPWERRYDTPYGFIDGTEGGDMEDLDVFWGGDAEATDAWWAVQTDSEGEFDEYKVFLGFRGEDAARACYARHIPIEYLHDMRHTSVAQIQALLGIHPTETIGTMEAKMAAADPTTDPTAAADPAAEVPTDSPDSGQATIDLLTVASDRLASLTTAVSGASGNLSPSTLIDLQGVVSMLELIPGVGEDAAMKSDGPFDHGAIIKDIVGMFAKAQREQDPVKKAAWFHAIEKATSAAAQVAGIQYGGSVPEPATPPVTKVPEQLSPTAPAKVAAGTQPVSTFGASSNGQMQVSKSLQEANAKLTAAVAAIKPAAVPAQAAPSATTVEVEKNQMDPWPEGYVDTLPDSSFLLVEKVAPALRGGGLPYRHFPIRDHVGTLSTWHVKKAIELLPVTAFAQDVKMDLAKRARSLLSEANAIAKSKGDANTRGDDGWAPDLADPRYMKNGKVERVPGPFGFDNLAGKIRDAK